MNKLSYIIVSLSVAALMMFSSCKKPNNIVTPISGGTVTNTFTASIGDGSKTYLDLTDGHAYVKWSGTDVINVNGIEQGNTLQIMEEGGGVGTTSGVFRNNSELIESPYFAAYNMADKIDFRLQLQQPVEIEGTQIPTVPYYNSNKWYFGIPKNQSTLNTVHLDYQQKPYGLLEGCIPMAAYSETNDLQFHNMVSIIKIGLKDYAESRETTTKVNRVTISSDENLWGVFSVTAPTAQSTDLVPSVAVLPTSQHGGGGPVQVQTPEIYSELGNVSLSTTDSEYVYFIIPVTSSASNMIHIRVEGTTVTQTRDGSVDETPGAYVKNINLQNADQPNKLHAISLDVKLEPVPYYFQVAINRLVQFSNSNLSRSTTGGFDCYYFETITNVVEGAMDQTHYTNEYIPTNIDHLVWTSHAAKAYYGYGYDYHHDFYSPDPDYTFGDNEILFTNYTATTPNPNFTVVNTTGPEKGVWRSLSTNEMKYLLGTDPSYNPEMPDVLYSRNQAREKCGKVKIRVNNSYTYSTRDVCGFLILPDNYDGYAMGFSVNDLNLGGPFGAGYKDFTAGINDQNVWDYLKEHGAVFLPSSGSTLASANNGDPSVTYTFDGCGDSGALYLSDGFITKDYQSQDYPPYNYKHYCNCFYWNGTTQTSSANWCTQSETKFGRLIRLVKDF